MKLSARNQFSGTVTAITKGPVSTEVTISVAPRVEVVAVISTTSAEALGLEIGKPAHVLIKANNVIVGVDE
jgi:molybdopterin-binding protein